MNASRFQVFVPPFQTFLRFTPAAKSSDARPRRFFVRFTAARPSALRTRLAARNQTARPNPPPSNPASGELVQLRLPDADLETVFSAYKIYSGLRIVRDPSIANARAVIHVITGVCPRDEALELMRQALRDQANIVLEPGAPGTLIAKRGPAR